MGRFSEAERIFIADGIAQDVRNDGRSREDFRPFTIETGIISQASGSARLQLGNTDVLATVRAELGPPPSGKPSHGRIEIAVECSPTAAREYEGRGGEELANDLVQALERSFLGGSSGAGSALDLTALCIAEGKTCWVLYLDALLLSMDGNLLDAIGIAFKAALNDLRLPMVEMAEDAEDEQDFELRDDVEGARIDVTNVPLIVTITKFGRHHIVDASTEEESQMSSALSIGVTSLGRIAGISKRGSVGLHPSIIHDMTSVAGRIAKSLHRIVDGEIVNAMERAKLRDGNASIE